MTSTPKTNGSLSIQRFYSLDVLRGLASLSVVLFHWQNFFFQGTTFDPAEPSKAPCYSLLWPIYDFGWLAVDLFFALSGFIFFWLYAQQLSERKIGGKEFFILRFSRLYPLHLATLIFVLAVQWFMRMRFGSFFVYTENDPLHFILHLFFASNWGFENQRLCFGLSLNAPVWSVSVEVLLYFFFFLLCRTKTQGKWHILATIMIAGCFCQPLHKYIGRGLFSFFSGGLSFMLFAYVQKRGLTARFFRFTVAGFLMGTASLMFLRSPHSYALYRSALGTKCVFHGHDIIGGALLTLQGIPLIFPLERIIFPTIIVSLALMECRRGTLGKRFALLGDISYSTYLLHFPLQLVFATLALYLGVDRSYFYSLPSLFPFFGILLLISWMSFHYFERPMQSWLRKKMGRSQKAPHSPLKTPV